MVNKPVTTREVAHACQGIVHVPLARASVPCMTPIYRTYSHSPSCLGRVMDVQVRPTVPALKEAVSAASLNRCVETRSLDATALDIVVSP